MSKHNALFERALAIAMTQRELSNARKDRALNLDERRVSTGERSSLSLGNFRRNTTAINRARNKVLQRQGRRRLAIEERGATTGERTVGAIEATGQRKTAEQAQNSKIFRALFPELSTGASTKAGAGGATGSFGRDRLRQNLRDRAGANIVGTIDDDLNLLRPRR